jgi:hypothetical protein
VKANALSSIANCRRIAWLVVVLLAVGSSAGQQEVILTTSIPSRVRPRPGPVCFTPSRFCPPRGALAGNMLQGD